MRICNRQTRGRERGVLAHEVRGGSGQRRYEKNEEMVELMPEVKES